MYFDSISRDKLGERDNCILLIRKPLLHVLRQLLIYLDAGLLCRHMHILKQQEIILVLRGFYTKPELPIVSAYASTEVKFLAANS